MSILQEKAWYVLQVAPRAEKKVAMILPNKGYQCFLPTYIARRKWSDRIKAVELPLFPGYVFARFVEPSVGLVCSTLSVIRVVSFGGRAYPICDSEIEAIRKVALSGLTVPVPYVAVGEKVVIKDGPLAGIVGIISRIKNQSRLIISVDMILSSISIDVDALQVCPAPERETAAFDS